MNKARIGSIARLALCIEHLAWVACIACALVPAAARAQDAGDYEAQEPAPSSRAPAPSALDAAIARHAREPSVQEVLRAALHARRDGTLRALRDRARLAGWVPTLGLKARRGQGVDLASSADDDGLRLATDDDLTLEAALTFHLDRVVFANEEVALAREARSARGELAKHAAEIIRLYFERKRLQLESDLLASRTPDEKTPGGAQSTPAVPDASQRAPSEAALQADIARRTRIAEIEAQLDVFTGGAFQRMMRRIR